MTPVTDDPTAWLDGFGEPVDDIDRIAKRVGLTRQQVEDSVRRLQTAGRVGRGLSRTVSAERNRSDQVVSESQTG